MRTTKPGVYRRAFDWRVSRADRESLPQFAAAFARLSSDEYADIFEDYLTITRKRKNNRTAMAKVQLHLMEELLIAQGAANSPWRNHGECASGDEVCGSGKMVPSVPPQRE
jgi:hypothetical protein